MSSYKGLAEISATEFSLDHVRSMSNNSFWTLPATTATMNSWLKSCCIYFQLPRCVTRMYRAVDDDITLQAIEFFEANEISRPVTIRTNTLRTRRRDLAQALINRGVNLEPIGKWTNVGLQVFESSVPIGRRIGFLERLFLLSLMPKVQHQSI